MTREATNRILTLIADGVLSAETVLNECLAYMSEDDVAEMGRLGGFFEDEDEDGGDRILGA